MATKKKTKKHTPHSLDATTGDGNGNSILREELVTNNNNLVPLTSLTRTSSNASNEMMGKCSSTSYLLLDRCKDTLTYLLTFCDDPTFVYWYDACWQPAVCTCEYYDAPEENECQLYFERRMEDDF